MSGLTQATCVPCRGGVPPLTFEELRPLLAEVPEWHVREVNGVKRLERTFAFPDFREAMTFANRVAELAETEQHHPDLHASWGKLRVEVWTHKIRGLHRNDFILAAKTDQLYAPSARDAGEPLAPASGADSRRPTGPPIRSHRPFVRDGWRSCAASRTT